MENKIINQQSMSVKISKSLGADPKEVYKVISGYFKESQELLLDGYTIMTPIGDIKLIRRNINKNFTDIDHTYKISVDISKSLKCRAYNNELDPNKE